MRDTYIENIEKFSSAVEKDDTFIKNIRDIEEILNLEEEMLSSYWTVMCLEGKVEDNFTTMAINIINKNLYFIYSALELTQIGQYAAARVIFRNIYESLIMLKTVSITGNQELLTKWISGDSINLNKMIFRKVKYPTSPGMEVLWNDLCKFCHGTIYSCQQVADYKKVKDKLKYNYILLQMLLFMNYHVLNRYVFSSSMKAMADRNICLWDDTMTLKDKRDFLRIKMKELKDQMPIVPRHVLIDFSKVWRFEKL